MLNSVNLPEKTFAFRFLLVLFQVIIQSLVNFAVGYKYTKLSKRGKNFPCDFFHYFAQRESYAELCFSFSERLSFSFAKSKFGKFFSISLTLVLEITLRVLQK